MKRNFVVCILLLVTALCYAQDVLKSSNGSWEVEFTKEGVIKHLAMDFGNGLVDVPWHSEGEYKGPAFRNRKRFIGFRPKGKFTYVRDEYDLTYTISYKEVNGFLTMEVSIMNNTPITITPGGDASMTMGIDHIMDQPATYYSKFFPSFLRCEKTHFLSYFQSPEGNVLAIATPDPVASWHLDYMGTGHRIATSHIDLLHQLPLPSRHPQDLFQLAPLEKRSWMFYFIPLSDIKQISSEVSKAITVPMLEMERVTASTGEMIDLKVYYDSPDSLNLKIIDPKGNKIILPPAKVESGCFSYQFQTPDITGTYKLLAESSEYVSEGSMYVRKPWSWYLKKAGAEGLRTGAKISAHREGWMSFFSAYWSLVYFPDAQMLEETESQFKRFWDIMVDPKTGFFYTTKNTWASRPQNTSWMLALLTVRYAATRNIDDLELAAQWADHLITKFQLPDGAFQGYTALTLGAKFIQDLLWFEKPLSNQREWKERYERHYSSLVKASWNLLQVKDKGETEGEATYEDNQVGSAWSLLAMYALVSGNLSDKDVFLKESIALQKRHECLTQAFTPDSRMRGGTLRWWEAQYDVLIHTNMMNSPHAWTMRSQFGAMYLYLLTGHEYYLNLAFNTMGTCVQAIEHDTGLLRWAFVPDPYIEIKNFVHSQKVSGEGEYVDAVVGEQWLPMISSWWKVNEQDKVPGLFERGWSCDNDVHEHFRYLSEMYIRNAFVIEREDGSIRTWNCSYKHINGDIVIYPAENQVTRVHFNLKRKHKIKVKFSGEEQVYKLDKGMQWVGPGLLDYKVPSIYLWQEMVKNEQN